MFLLESGNLHYRLSHREHHHHLICVGCGSVKDFSDGSLESVVKDLVKPEGFESAGTLAGGVRTLLRLSGSRRVRT